MAQAYQEPPYFDLLPFGKSPQELLARADGVLRSQTPAGAYTEARAKKLLLATAVGASPESAAAYAGCSAETLAALRARYPEFDLAMRCAEGEGAVANLANIQRAAAAGQWQAAAWILERRFPDQYGKRRPAQEIGAGAPGTTVNVYLPENARFALQSGQTQLVAESPGAERRTPPQALVGGGASDLVPPDYAPIDYADLASAHQDAILAHEPEPRS